MKTPMQELIEQLKFCRNNTKRDSPEQTAYAVAIAHAESLLEKEKEVMCKFQDLAQRSDFWVEYDGAEGCFDKTFNTKEK